MLKIKRRKRIFKKSEKGMALVEAIPVLFTVVIVFNFSLGFFGAVHSGILNSIASYNYTLETFRFKSNLIYFRPGGGTTNYSKSMNRVHGTTQDGSEAQTADSKEGRWPATMRGITMTFKKEDPTKNLSIIQDGKNKTALADDLGSHRWSDNLTGNNIWRATSTYTPDGSTAIQTPRIWIKTLYGICLNAECKK